MIPDSLQPLLWDTLGREIASTRRVSGGSINQAAKITLADGTDCFLKWNRSADPRMFSVEEKGLALLDSAETTLRVPEVFATGQTEEGTGFLVQEFLVEGRAGPGSPRQFGRGLAQLHRHRTEHYGLDHDNFIGRLPQSNSRHEEWVPFFIEERLEPQLERAIKTERLNKGIRKNFESLYKQLNDIFPDEPPSLIHGDLWGGNYFYDDSGTPTIYDPAVYYGHREMELAFTHLFGGFSGDFYSSYEESYPLEAGFMDRKNIYNLYPLLVHTNLFGGSYARQVESIIRRF